MRIASMSFRKNSVQQHNINRDQYAKLGFKRHPLLLFEPDDMFFVDFRFLEPHIQFFRAFHKAK